MSVMTENTLAGSGIRAALPGLVLFMNPYPSPHRLAITRLGAVSLLQHGH